MKTLTVSYEEPQVEIRSLTIRNNVHNSYGETVEESVTITYPGGTPSRNFYTYWPGQDTFRFGLSLEGTAYVTDAWIIVTDYDGRTVRINLDTARPGFYEGEYLNEDPDCPPVGFEVHWLQIVNIQEPDDTEEHHTTNTEIIPIMDPSGFVYEGMEDNRVEGAKVTLECGRMADGAVVYDSDWNAGDYGQTNGYLTNVKGEFKWDVPAGWWRVRVEKNGYETAYSDWMQVPPPQTGVKIDLVPEVPAQLYESVTVSEDGSAVTLYFTQPVQFHTLKNAITVTDCNGKPVDGELMVSKILDLQGNTRIVREVTFLPDEPVSFVRAAVSEAAKSVHHVALEPSAAIGSNGAVAVSDLELENGTATVQVHIFAGLMDEQPQQSLLLVASYDEHGKFLGMETTAVESGAVEVSCKTGTDFVKAFVVDAMDTMIPVCEAVSSK